MSRLKKKKKLILVIATECAPTQGFNSTRVSTRYKTINHVHQVFACVDTVSKKKNQPRKSEFLICADTLKSWICAQQDLVCAGGEDDEF